METKLFAVFCYLLDTAIFIPFQLISDPALR